MITMVFLIFFAGAAASALYPKFAVLVRPVAAGDNSQASLRAMIYLM